MPGWRLLARSGWLCALAALAACGSLPDNVSRPVSHAYTDTDDTWLGRASSAYRQDHEGQSGLHLLTNGSDAFVARVALAEMAERSIDAQYYFLRNDLVSRLFIEQLLRAADRGVRVRLLIDDMELDTQELALLAADNHPNMEVRSFNPFARNMNRAVQFLTRLGRADRRMHNKSFIVDNKFAILGGRNIGDEYFSADPQFSLIDLDAIAVGPVVERVSSAFDLFWNDELAYPVTSLAEEKRTEAQMKEDRANLSRFVQEQSDSDYLLALRNSELETALTTNSVKFYWGDAEVFYDPPEKLIAGGEKSEQSLTEQLSTYIEPLSEELIIFSPYFIPGEDGVHELRALTENGVRVRVLTNSLASNDVAAVYAGFLKYRRDLLSAGVELYEMDKAQPTDEMEERSWLSGSSKITFHGKSFVYDRKAMFIGSLNLDPRSMHYNTEIGIVLHSEEMAVHTAEVFEDWIGERSFRLQLVSNEDGELVTRWHGYEDGEPLVYDYEPRTSMWQRFWVHFLSWFPVQSLL